MIKSIVIYLELMVMRLWFRADDYDVRDYWVSVRDYWVRVLMGFKS